MKQELIAGKVYFIEGERRGRYPYANALLVEDDLSILMDTGMGPEKAAVISRKERVNMVLNSHWHEDHTYGNKFFPDARVGVHHMDAPSVRSVDTLLENYDVPDEKMREGVRQFLISMFGLADSKVDMEMYDGDVINTGAMDIKVVHTPGHSAGHCSFEIPAVGLVFLADIDFTSFGPWYGCHDSNIDMFITSLEELMNKNYEIAVPGHKEVVTGAKAIREELRDYLNIIYAREEKIREVIGEEKTIDEIVAKAVIYGRFPEAPDMNQMYRAMEKTMVEKHLHRLINLNMAEWTGRGYVSVTKSF